MAKAKKEKSVIFKIKTTILITIFTYVLIAVTGLLKLISMESVIVLCINVLFVAVLVMVHYFTEAAV
jgi:hypothetical protein